MEEYTWKELINKYNWNISLYKKASEKIQYAKARGVFLQELPRENENQTLKYIIIGEYPYYTREELIQKFNLSISKNTASTYEFIRYCQKRGIIIEKLGTVLGTASYRIIDSSDYTLDNEIWKDAPGTSMKVSNLGRVKAKDGRIKNQRLMQGYCYVTDGIYNKTWRVHRLVMLAFNPIDNAQDFDVDHIDGQRTNNKLENLRWITSQRNIQLRDENKNKLGDILAELVQDYGYDEIYEYLVQKRKPKNVKN